MSDFLTAECFGCGANIDPLPGNYYCSACIKEQLAEERTELQAFDAFHAFADSILKREEQ